MEGGGGGSQIFECNEGEIKAALTDGIKLAEMC